MKLSKPNFWDKKNSLLSNFFLPFSLITRIIIFLRKKLIKPVKFKIPIICIGNIYVGGTGKTPISILIAKELFSLGKKTAIIRKFYSSHQDEYLLIKKDYDNLIVKKNRSSAILEANNSGFDLVVLDDGFQDYKIQKNFNIICFNQNQKIGNGKVFPAGPLRENLTSLKNAQVAIINGLRDPKFEEELKEVNEKIKIYYSEYRPINLEQFRNKSLTALAAIGNPDNFFKLLKQNNLNIIKKIQYPDHYVFSKNEVSEILNEAHKNNSQIIMTEKDFFKFKKFDLLGIECLRVELIIKEKEQLIKHIINSL